jgi:solute:Na+ symporter, SSS family
MPPLTNGPTSILGLLDWIVIVGYAVSVLAIGWYYQRRNKTTEDYLVGGRHMRPFTVGLSYFVALFSTITYLSVPGETIRYGPMVLAATLGLPLVVPIVGWSIVPVFTRLRVTSGYELLGMRFGMPVRLLGVCIFLAMRLLWMSVIIYATVDKVLIPLTGLPESASLWICVGLAALTIVYTTMGGLQAVVMVDAFQAILLFGGVMASLVIITYSLGGIGAWWPDHWLTTWEEPRWFHASQNGRSVFGMLVAILTWWVATAGSDQVAIQRYLATRDARAARRMLAVSVAASILIKLMLSGLGLALLAYAAAHPEWMPAGVTIENSADRLFPRFVATILPTGISGLIIAGMLAEAMNSLSSGINSVSCVVVTDLFGIFRRGESKAQNATVDLQTVRWVSVCVGLLVVALSVLVRSVEGNLFEISQKVVNLLTVPLFGLFVMAIFVRWATPFGACATALAGIATVSAINYWTQLTGQPEPPISFLWAMPLALFVEVFVGMLASLLPIGTARPMLSTIESPERPSDAI